MYEDYDTSPEAYRAICDRVGPMMNVVAVQMQSHPWIVGMCMISVMKERYGREGLDDVIKMATRMRRSLLNDEKSRRKGRGELFEG